MIERLVIDRELGTAHLIIYRHLPIFIGLVLFASAIRQNIVENLSVPDIALLFSISILLYLIPILLIALEVQALDKRAAIQRNTIIILVWLVLISLFRHYLSSVGVSAIIAGLMVFYVFINTPGKASATSEK